MAGYVGNIPVPQGTQTRQSFTATASQTSFPTIGYTAGFIDVYLNGVKLIDGTDFTASNGSDVVLTTAAAADDVLNVVIFDTFDTSSGTFSATTLKNNVTLKNDTEQDTDGGRASKIIYQGEQSGGEISTLAEIQASHDGTADDEKGDLIFRTNDGSDGSSPTTAMTIDSAQNVGIGTSSPSTRVHIVPPDNTTANKITYGHGVARANANEVISGGFDSEFVTRDGNVNTGAFVRVLDVNTNGSFPTTIRGGNIVFGTVDGTSGASADASERMRIDHTGHLLIGTSTIQGTGHTFSASQYNAVASGTSSFQIVQFRNPNGKIGTIALSGSATAYNTSSDYRLKENLETLSSAITRVKALKPKRFSWISDKEDSANVDGFLAHEAATVVPEAVTGTYDEVDEDGNPEYQGIDQSKLVPLLTAALQEAIAKIETLETKVAALEAE